MAFSIPELKECSLMIAGAYSITETDARKILNYFLQSGRGDVVRDLIAGKLDAVTGAADALGIKTGAFQGIPEKPNKKRSHKRKETDAGRDRIQAASVEWVTGDVLPADFSGGVPGEIVQRVEDALADFCQKYHIEDLSKERQPRWAAACRWIGESVFKCSDVLRDKNKPVGGAYDVEKISALVDLYGFMCDQLVKAPFIDDFAHFAGVSDSWLYGVGSPGGLTPARASLLQKLKLMQERGLAGLIADGRQNPTGALAILNHWHNWVQVREVVHTDGGTATGAAALPVFSAGDGLLIEEKPEKP